MDVPTPPRAVSAVSAVNAAAAFARQRLAEVGEKLGPLRSARTAAPRAGASLPVPRAELVTARQLAMVIVGATAPFAPTTHARARLLRQAYASGLFAAREPEPARARIGAPR
jgi:hypothetical protein